MPATLNQPALILSNCQEYFPIWLKRFIDIQDEIRAVEYGAKISKPQYNEPSMNFNLAKHMQIKLAKIDKDPSKEGKFDLLTLKQNYKKIAQECCRYLEFLLQHDCAASEMLALKTHYAEYVKKLLSINSKESWDELYNFSILLKDLEYSYPSISFFKSFRIKKIEPALDAYYGAKEIRDSFQLICAEMEPKLLKRKALQEVHAEIKRGLIFTSLSISPSSESCLSPLSGSSVSMSCYSSESDSPSNKKTYSY